MCDAIDWAENPANCVVQAIVQEVNQLGLITQQWAQQNFVQNSGVNVIIDNEVNNLLNDFVAGCGRINIATGDASQVLPCIIATEAQQFIANGGAGSSICAQYINTSSSPPVISTGPLLQCITGQQLAAAFPKCASSATIDPATGFVITDPFVTCLLQTYSSTIVANVLPAVANQLGQMLANAPPEAAAAVGSIVLNQIPVIFGPQNDNYLALPLLGFAGRNLPVFFQNFGAQILASISPLVGQALPPFITQNGPAIANAALPTINQALPALVQSQLQQLSPLVTKYLAQAVAQDDVLFQGLQPVFSALVKHIGIAALAAIYLPLFACVAILLGALVVRHILPWAWALAIGALMIGFTALALVVLYAISEPVIASQVQTALALVQQNVQAYAAAVGTIKL